MLPFVISADIPQHRMLASKQSQETSKQPRMQTPLAPGLPRTTDAHEGPIDAFDNQDLGQEENSLYATDTLNFEYYGPRCMMSFYSQPAVDWIVLKVESPEYNSSVKRLVQESARMLKMNHAYFEEGSDLAWGLVERPVFESRLRAHFSGAHTPVTDDKGWYALRNIIWAHGCQIVLSKTRAFHDTLQASWALFQNALSVHTEIMFLHTSLMGVQALISMAYFSESMGEVSLQYTLCTDALRLACSKGLHRQPSHSWKIPPHEVRHRNWIFWSIYCLEKQICTRSGRPSIMDDDEISCQVPQTVPSGLPSDTLYCHTLIKMMQLASTARKQLSSARALRQTTDQLFQAVHNLREELAEFKNSVQQHICLDDAIDVARLPAGMTLRQAQSLQSHYFCLVLDINTPLTYPWLDVSTYVAGNMMAASQVHASYNDVVQVSRAAILAARQVHIDGGCAALIARYAPLYSFFNLFIHIIRDTTLSTVPSDLLLLDLTLGYFSNLELTTGLQLPRLFVREMCHFARLAVKHQERSQKSTTEPEISKEIEANESFQPAPLTNSTLSIGDTDTVPLLEQDFFELFPAEDFETWSTLVPFDEATDWTF
ncbi:hypothetical protein Z517_00290 [Fonsecaea pedrosoi CBS 271.37]|uniref:Xylanolytic transcriptional activator regulatory domain-containing protein n=1 Tax=Fonsecaea pedrosoi CBS 271.37 TaxID=1442368 RepID=A0A0D2FE59_9EURO|nr:uncharacterized protein Z517_00290 [Fonsecaea pedrosoi CBS 271.37]KIW84902.1 hypothetical protein Z517_00290 [Fonsecaea pedrosoi CBS 271.37]